MILLICYFVTFFACWIGTICGMGGGIIIKPVLDATGIMTVSTITFLSGCTVIAMTCWSVGKTLIRGESVIDVKNTTFLSALQLGELLEKSFILLLLPAFPILIQPAVFRQLFFLLQRWLPLSIL